MKSDERKRMACQMPAILLILILISFFFAPKLFSVINFDFSKNSNQMADNKWKPKKWKKKNAGNETKNTVAFNTH